MLWFLEPGAAKLYIVHDARGVLSSMFSFIHDIKRPNIMVSYEAAARLY